MVNKEVVMVNKEVMVVNSKEADMVEVGMTNSNKDSSSSKIKKKIITNKRL